MKAVGLLCVVAAAQTIAPLHSGGAVVFDFKNTDGFAFTNYQNRLSMETRECAGEWALVFKNGNSGRCDTYWSLTTPRFPVRDGKRFAVKVRTKSDIQLKSTMPPSAVLWYAADGRELLAQDALGQDSPVVTPLHIRTSHTAYRDFAVSELVPEGAAFAKVRMCADYPNMDSGQVVAISRIEYAEKGDGVAWGYDDLAPPKVERLTPSPSSDFSSPVSFRISDPSGVAKVSISLDGTDVTERVSFSGNVATYTPRTPWAEDSIHEFEFSVADRRGNDDVTSRFICFTRGKVLHEKVAIRDDGMILCGAKPFFPIGIASVWPRPFNGNSVSRAVKELGEAGFNLLSTYASPDSDVWRELVSACEREGIKVKLGPGPCNSSKKRLEIIGRTVFAGRSRPSTFSWCIGDDTSRHRMPEDVAMDNELIHAVDPDAITDHADASDISGPLARFAPCTDIFCGENYPIRSEQPEPNELPKVQRAILVAYGDLRMGGARTPCVIPILQAFSGWSSWKRYPTEEEIRAMTFLAIACRARGIRYYTYTPSKPDPKNCGVISTPERFAAITRIAREISALSPQLVARDAAVQPEVRIVEGPEKASYGFPSITALLKKNGLLIAVNISPEPVKAVLSLPDGRSQKLSLARNGVFVGRFAARRRKSWVD